MKNVIWVGPDLPITINIRNSTISPAAYYWQSSFKSALKKNGVNVVSISYQIERIWPFGKLYIDSINDKFNDNYYVSYLNLYKIREIWIAVAVFLKSIKFNSYDIITYNSISRNVYFAYLRKLFFTKSKWYSILADDYVRSKPDALIFLSYGYYNSYKHKNKYHFNGALDHKIINTKANITKKNILLYSGAISEWTGINEFVHLFSQNTYSINWELHIYGKGDVRQINKYTILNKNIKYFGFVDEQILIDAASNAQAFINPRPINIASGENNFPSKLLFYLLFGKCIISTRTEGLSPEFDSLLIYSDLENTNSLSQTLSNIEKGIYQDKVEMIAKYQINNTWETKVAKLLLELK